MVIRSRRFPALLLICLLLICALVAPAAAQTSVPAAAAGSIGKVAPWVLDQTANGAEADFLVILNDQADVKSAAGLPTRIERGRFVREALWQKAQAGQRPLRDWLEQRGIAYSSFYVVSLLALRGDRALVMALAARPDVARIEGNPQIHNALPRPVTGLGAAAQWPVPAQSLAVEPGIIYTGAPDVWAMGYTGQGIVIGGQDTGYQWDHPALKFHYRGWNGSGVSHDYNWHDSIHSQTGSCGADSPQPCDVYGHGTHTMGTVLGDDGAGNQIGMAPGATWIGCRDMDNSGVGQPSSYMECFEFFLAPYPVGGTPAEGNPDLAPDVTNNSWGCPASEGCSAGTLQAALENQQAAGIMTVASAGNNGSSCSSVTDPPSLYGAAYTVGALNTGTDSIAPFSGRGPVTVDGSNRRKPDISAPGTNVRSSFPAGAYGFLSGTSMAAPHAAGAVALLWSARPALRHRIPETEQVLDDAAAHISSADCDAAGGWPNNTYGYGRLNIKQAVDQTPPDAAALSGIVTDPAGLPLARASLRATAAAGQFATTLSGSDGRYSLMLAGGAYTVTATAAGYLSYLTGGLPVHTGVSSLLDVSLFVTPTHVITGFVSDIYTHSPVSATLSLSGTSMPPKQSDPLTGYYSLSAPPGTVTLRAAADKYAVQTLSVDVGAGQRQDFGLAPNCVLVVNGDTAGNYTHFYTDSLARLGKPYDVSQIRPDLATLNWYQAVVWSTGDLRSGTLTAADRANLAAYLDGGGRLFVSGQNIGTDIGGTDFYHDDLHALYQTDNSQVLSLLGLSFLTGQNPTISGGDGAYNQTSPDGVAPVNGAASVYQYAGSTLSAGISAWGPAADRSQAVFRTVYFAFGYEAINAQAQRDAVMGKVLDYLGACTVPQAPQPGFATAGPVPMPKSAAFVNTTHGAAGMTYTWDFGDHTPLSHAANPVHTFPQVGAYTTVLTATNRYGQATYSGLAEIPDLSVSLGALVHWLAPGGAATDTLRLINSGSSGRTWHLSETPAVSWLAIDPVDGSLSPLGSVSITVTYGAPAVHGTYTTILHFTTSDPLAAAIDVPVTLVVPYFNDLPILIKP
jgi:serine protease AprX